MLIDQSKLSLLQSGQWTDISRRKGMTYIDQSEPIPLQSGQWTVISRRKDKTYIDQSERSLFQSGQWALGQTSLGEKLMLIGQSEQG
jgi:hypothetical protein